MIKTKKIFLTLFFFVFLGTAFTPVARADYWGANFDAANYQMSVEQAIKKIEDTLIAKLKIMAVQLIQKKIKGLLSGGGASGGRSLIISDWRQFIYGSAQKYSTQVTNNFFQNQKAGAPSGIQKNVINPAQKAVNTDYWGMKPDLQNYVAEGKAENIFKSGATRNPWQAWRMAAMPQNDLAFMYLRAESFKQEAFRTEEEKKKAEGVAGQGYKGVEKSSSGGGSGGKSTLSHEATAAQNITTPASTVKSTAEAGLQSPLQILENATSLPEVITSIALQMITQVIQQGLNQVGNKLGAGSLGINAGQIQQLIQGGARTAPNSFFK